MREHAKSPDRASLSAASRESAGTTRPSVLPVERLLRTLGGESPLADDVLGDLAEEFAQRSARDGAGVARWWYAWEALRSAPHLVRGAIRHGSPAGRARLAVWLAGSVFLSLGIVVALLARGGPPARLVVGAEGVTNRLVVSTMRPVLIPVRVLDSSGALLPESDVRYAWESGARASVSPRGVVRCNGRGDALVRASLGSLIAHFRLSCQPVRELRTRPWHNLVLGGPAQELRVGGIGVDGAPVTRLAAKFSVEDTTVAVLDDMWIRPLSPGRTFVNVNVGGHSARTAVTVFEPVSTLEGLRPDQRYVVAVVRLRPGEEVRWPLSEGRYWLVNQVNGEGDAPALGVAGPVACLPAPEPGVHRTHCVVRRPGAFVTLARQPTAASAIVAELAVEKEADR